MVGGMDCEIVEWPTAERRSSAAVAGIAARPLSRDCARRTSSQVLTWTHPVRWMRVPVRAPTAPKDFECELPQPPDTSCGVVRRGRVGPTPWVVRHSRML